MDELFKDYKVNKKREHGFIYINIIGKGRFLHVSFRTSFRVEQLLVGEYIIILYHSGWNSFAPLIVEYVVNTWKVKMIQLQDVYDT